MKATGLNGRVTRLECLMAPPPLHRCRSCGLRHVQPLTMDLARRIIGPVSLMATGLLRRVAEDPAPKLCLCPCCGDPGDRWFARRSHGPGTGPDTRMPRRLDSTRGVGRTCGMKVRPS
jgi:hypothetical protein